MILRVTITQESANENEFFSEQVSGGSFQSYSYKHYVALREFLPLFGLPLFHLQNEALEPLQL